MTNRHKIIAAIIIGVLAVAGVSAFNNSSSSPTSSGSQVASVSTASTNPSSATTGTETNSYAYISDFKTGYSDGYAEGVSGFAYPDQSLLANSTRGYTDGFSQGYNDGQSQQAALANRLCSQASVSGARSSNLRSQSYSSGGGRSSSGVLGAREERPDNGLSTGWRRALLIGGGAAAGAGLGGAFGGKKGALIGAAVGGGTGTALAFTKKPSRAFNRRVTTKDVVVKSLIGAGAGAGIGALAGGKRGALSGAALGGGGGLIWSLLSGQRTRR